jgi:hypothetical protein
VSDRHSVNGTAVIAPTGRHVPCPPDTWVVVPDGATIALGDLRLSVSSRRAGPGAASTERGY